MGRRKGSEVSVRLQAFPNVIPLRGMDWDNVRELDSYRRMS